LDLYASAERPRIQVDIEGEAQAYFVQSLAGAGGAAAAARYFDASGERPYQKHVLLALGQHLRRYGEYGDATRDDQLFIARLPLDPDALLSACRMIETQERAEQHARALEARLGQADHFAPGS